MDATALFDPPQIDGNGGFGSSEQTDARGHQEQCRDRASDIQQTVPTSEATQDWDLSQIGAWQDNSLLCPSNPASSTSISASYGHHPHGSEIIHPGALEQGSSLLLEQQELDEALLAIGSDLEAQLDELDRQRTLPWHHMVYNPPAHVQQPTFTNDVQVSNPVAAVKCEIKEEEGNAYLDIMNHDDSEGSDVAGDEMEVLYIPRASQRRARTRRWPRRSSMTVSLPFQPLQFEEYNIGGKDGHMGEDSGRNLMALFGNDLLPRTRFTIRITRGRLRPIRPTQDQYPVATSAIPGGTALETICREWPLHVWGSGLRLFMAEGWSSERIWRLLPAAVRRSGDAGRPWNYLQQAMGRECDRMWVEEGQPRRQPQRKRTVAVQKPENEPEANGAASESANLIDQNVGDQSGRTTLPPQPSKTPASSGHRDDSTRTRQTNGKTDSQQHRQDLTVELRREIQTGLDLELRLGQLADTRYIGLQPRQQQQFARDLLRSRLRGHRHRLREQLSLPYLPGDRGMDLYRAIHRLRTRQDPTTQSDPTLRAGIQNREFTYALQCLRDEQRQLNAFLHQQLVRIT